MGISVKDASEALANVNLRAMIIGPPGAGKTHFCSTCPKVYYMQFSEGESDTFATRPELRGNIVKVATMVPGNDEELKIMFGDLDKGIENGAIHKAIAEAKALAAEGKVETLVLDTVTYLVEYLWQYINAFCKKTTYNGELDTRGMYGELNTRLTRLIGLGVCSFPGNLIATTHEMLESDEAMEKKTDKSSPIVANILGGFRNKIEGMFSVNMYLTKLPQGEGKYKYYARLNKGTGKNAKSRLPLPEVVEGISYPVIMEEIKKVSGVSGNPKGK